MSNEQLAKATDYLVPTAQKAMPATGGPAPFVAFRGSKTLKNLDDLEAAGIDVNMFYLVDGQPWKIDPMSLHLLTYKKYYTAMDNDTFELTDANWDDQGGLLDEHIEALVLVVRPNGDNPSAFTPARLTLRKGQAAALRLAINVYNGSAQSPSDLLSLGDEYKACANCPVIGGRFRVTIRSESKMPKVGRNPYNLGIGRVSATPAKDVTALVAFAHSPAGIAAINHVGASFASRCEDIEKLIPVG